MGAVVGFLHQGADTSLERDSPGEEELPQSCGPERDQAELKEEEQLSVPPSSCCSLACAPPGRGSASSLRGDCQGRHTGQPPAVFMSSLGLWQKASPRAPW